MRPLVIEHKVTSQDSISMRIYLNQIGKYDLLEPEEEVTLAIRIKQGDQQAFDKLVCANLRFVVSVAKQFPRYGFPLCDLINEGNKGLIKAAIGFDETKGFKFISYAVNWIRSAIGDFLAKRWKVVRIPHNVSSAYLKMNKEKEKHLADPGFMPSLEQIAKVTGCSLANLKRAHKYVVEEKSLDDPYGYDDSESTFGEFIVGAEPDMSKHENEAFQYELDSVIQKLKPREREVIKLFFGIDCLPRSLEEIGWEFDLTRETIRTTRDNALRKLRMPHRSKKLRQFL